MTTRHPIDVTIRPSRLEAGDATVLNSARQDVREHGIPAATAMSCSRHPDAPHGRGRSAKQIGDLGWGGDAVAQAVKEVQAAVMASVLASTAAATTTS